MAHSYNYYPLAKQRPEQGVAHIALGLGHTVVSGGVALRWRGDAYFDANWGPEPLEARFERWDWSRGMLKDHY